MRYFVFLTTLFLLIAGCGDRSEGTGEKGKVEKAVEEVVTKEFKLYDKAKQSMQKSQEASEKRREAEKELK